MDYLDLTNGDSISHSKSPAKISQSSTSNSRTTIDIWPICDMALDNLHLSSPIKPVNIEPVQVVDKPDENTAAVSPVDYIQSNHSTINTAPLAMLDLQAEVSDVEVKSFVYFDMNFLVY